MQIIRPMGNGKLIVNWGKILSYWPHALIAITLFGFAYLLINAR
jgi:hypothetical protein